ncbi:1-acylglycerol-3-phosphate O [Neolentinus lepideus HHB14362 ss-1]|uniref:1-acyl-sn-glycerol-3-phosphate acyltransferase n=1 Tax=Neolentinus lepideus HHB14362 ss-1 TaxID=1314782 RepID=A0A165V9I8_9AGAM|nr:1-acylglycerol-3-phosphate O [Neolentinus lepideus HHB14362 ss-1]
MSILGTFVRPLAYVSVPFFLIHTLANHNPLIKYYLRLGLYLSTLGICSVWGAMVAVGMSLAGRRFDVNFVTARSFYLLTSRVLGIKFVVEGEEHLDTRPAVLVGNHQSMLDIIYLGRIFPKRASIMAKKELQWMPLLGQYMTLSGAVFVDRGNNAKAVQSLMEVGEIMKERHTSLWMFPEGTRSMREYHDMLPFKKGGFHLAVQAQVPIVPVVCENYWRLYRKGVLGSGTLKIRVLPPVSTTGLTTADIPDLVNRVRDQMVAALREISILLPQSAYPESKTEEVQPPQEEVPTVDQPVAPEPEPEQSEPETPSESGSSVRRVGGNENGTETEEDEGMVLVGRPS